MNKRGENDEFSYTYLAIFIIILVILEVSIFSLLTITESKRTCENAGLKYSDVGGKCFELKDNRIITYKVEQIGFLKFKVNKFASVPD